MQYCLTTSISSSGLLSYSEMLDHVSALPSVVVAVNLMRVSESCIQHMLWYSRVSSLKLLAQINADYYGLNLKITINCPTLVSYVTTVCRQVFDSFWLEIPRMFARNINVTTINQQAFVRFDCRNFAIPRHALQRIIGRLRRNLSKNFGLVYTSWTFDFVPDEVVYTSRVFGRQVYFLRQGLLPTVVSHA